MDSVDLSQSKPGDTCHYRNGGTGVIESWRWGIRSNQWFWQDAFGQIFEQNGRIAGQALPTPVDIVRVTPAVRYAGDLESATQ